MQNSRLHSHNDKTEADGFVYVNEDDQYSSTSSRCSSRGIKRKSFFDEATDITQSTKKPVRPCERSGCPASIPICFANSTEKCVGSGYTSRWHHISAGEHFCNECFEYFYRSHKSGYETFCKWKREWSSKGKAEASICVFLADNLLPFWVQCTRSECQKWRQLSRDVDFTPDFIRKFKCGMTSEGKTKEKQLEACAVPEDHTILPMLLDTALQILHTFILGVIKIQAIAKFGRCYANLSHSLTRQTLHTVLWNLNIKVKESTNSPVRPPR
ncbi:KDM1B [Acanthosepion pharaonis]|uniref:KDM1B n=1 Tax=Acanthosepion pharaonis TaxID=158019 RepID=A0A812DJD0_ACAPH|nr:KDM1B [Sepia pharaonis]